MQTASFDYISAKIRSAIASIDERTHDQFIDLLLSKKTIFIYGSGRSGLVGQFFAVRLVQMGLDVHFVGDMTTPIIEDDDLTVIVSNTGETVSAVQTANIARRIGSHVVSITSNPNSKLAHASSSIVLIDIEPDEKEREYAPLGTIFEESVNIFFDSIVPCIMKKLKLEENDLRKRHAIWV